MIITLCRTDLHGRFCVIASKIVFNNIDDAAKHIRTAPYFSGEEYWYAWYSNGEYAQRVFERIRELRGLNY